MAKVYVAVTHFDEGAPAKGELRCSKIYEAGDEYKGAMTKEHLESGLIRDKSAKEPEKSEVIQTLGADE